MECSKADKKRSLQLAIIVLIAIVGVIAIYVIVRSRELSNRLVCASHLKEIGSMIKIYGEFEGHL